MIRIVIVIGCCLGASGCLASMLAGDTAKELANTHVFETGLKADEDAVIFRGTEHHGCKRVRQENVNANNFACPELPEKNPIGCRVEGGVIRCACTGDKPVCEKLIHDIVAEGRTP